MRSSRMLPFFVCLMLILGIVPCPAYAEDPPPEPLERRIVFKVWDKKTGSSILESVYNSGKYELYNSNDSRRSDPMSVAVTSNSASAHLQIGESYDLKVTLPDYYPLNKRFDVTPEGHDWLDIHMYRTDQVKHLGFDSVSVDVHTGDASGLEVRVVTDKVSEELGELIEGRFTAALILETGWDVETDGLPVETEAFPEDINDSRYIQTPSGEYLLFVGLFDGEMLAGYTTGVVDIPEEQPGPGEQPGEDEQPGEGEIRVTFEARNEIESRPVENAVFRLSDGNNDFTGTTDAHGRATFILVADCSYDVNAEIDGYYRANARFKPEDHSPDHGPAWILIPLYKIDAITEVEESAIHVSVHETGSPGVDVSVKIDELQTSYTGKLPEEFPDEFAVALIRDSSWDVPWDIEAHGLPVELMEAPPEPLDRTRQESIHLDGDSEEVVIFVAFFREIVEHDHEDNLCHRRVLSGYAFTRVLITQVQEGDDPHGPPPGETGSLVFVHTSGDAESEEIEIEFDTRLESLVVPIPASEAGSIGFPREFNGRTLTLSWIDDHPWGAIYPDSFDGTVDENGLTYEKPFKRVRLLAQLEGEWRPYEFILCQPGYEQFELRFSLNDGDSQYVMEHDGTWERRHVSFELPKGLESGTIAVTVHWPDGIDNRPPEEDIGPIGGAIWEYLVDRSEYVVNASDVLTFNRGFGKVTLHYGFLAGYSWEDAMVTFYESDFAGIDVIPEVGAGDWHTGIVNVSEASLEALTPSAFVYFLNERVFIRPSDVGRPFEIMAATSAEEGVESTQGELWFDPEAWAVTLPDITKPVTRLNLRLRFLDNDDDNGDDNSHIREVPLDIKRVLLDAFTLEFRESGEAGPQFTPRMTEFEYCGYEEFITFVSVFSFTETDEEDPNYFEIDHTLLVNYYEDDTLLGARQFRVYTGPDDPRHEIPVFRQGSPEYAGVASANRITAFLISKEGISADDNTFGGAVFGIGAGWGHLMPNHAEYGSGKDGMDYE